MILYCNESEAGIGLASIPIDAALDKRISGKPFQLLVLLSCKPQSYRVTPIGISESFPCFTPGSARYALDRLHKAGYTTVVVDKSGCFVDRIVRDYSRTHPGFSRFVARDEQILRDGSND